MNESTDFNSKIENYLPVVQLYKIPRGLDIIAASQESGDCIEDLESFKSFLQVKSIDGRITTTLFNGDGFFASCDRVKLMPKIKMTLVINTDKGLFWIRFIEKTHIIDFLRVMLCARKTEVPEISKETPNETLKESINETTPKDITNETSEQIPNDIAKDLGIPEQMSNDATKDTKDVISEQKTNEIIEKIKDISVPEAVTDNKILNEVVKESENKKRKLSDINEDNNVNTEVQSNDTDSDDDIMIVEEKKGDKTLNTQNKRFKYQDLNNSFEYSTVPVFQDYTLPLAVEARIDLTRLIVSRLKKIVRDRDLQNLFPGCIDIKLAKESNKYNMAFIRFKNADDAKKCLDKMNHKEVFGRAITITYANKIIPIQ